MFASLFYKIVHFNVIDILYVEYIILLIDFGWTPGQSGSFGLVITVYNSAIHNNESQSVDVNCAFGMQAPTKYKMLRTTEIPVYTTYYAMDVSNLCTTQWNCMNK